MSEEIEESVYLNFPKRFDFKSEEEFQESVDNYYKENGLKQQNDFSDDEKRAVIEDCTVNLIGPKVLSQKYKTTIFVIRRIVSKTGLSITPDDLSLYPDFPKKTEEMTEDQYQARITLSVLETINISLSVFYLQGEAQKLQLSLNQVI